MLKGLSEAGYQVSVAFNKEGGLKMIAESAFDLVLLDIMLPDGDGVSLCKEIRAQGIRTPVLFLTALGAPENIALGLDGGGDDYLVKPFKFVELNARIKALLRRVESAHAPMPKHTIYSVADLTLDDDAKRVERNGQAISLTATEYRLLLVLLKNNGKVLSRADLLESAWDITFNMGTNVVDVYINYLRKKVDTDAKQKLIHTVIGMGYVLKEN